MPQRYINEDWTNGPCTKPFSNSLQKLTFHPFEIQILNPLLAILKLSWNKDVLKQKNDVGAKINPA